MDSAERVIFVLQVILALGPLAVYFLGLGLVNSQSRPHMANARSDFLILTIAFVPVIVLPVVSLVRQGMIIPAGLAVLLVGLLFTALLPANRGRWVVYNISEPRCRRLLERACRRLGWSAGGSDGRIEIASRGLRIIVGSLPWLRNVTLQIESTQGGATSPNDEAELMGAVGREIAQEFMLPSPTGASLVLVGAALLGFPMWYLFSHMDAIVDVLRQLLVA